MYIDNLLYKKFFLFNAHHISITDSRDKLIVIEKLGLVYILPLQ